MNEVIVKVEHLRQVHYCAGGTKTFFKRHGLDWQKFIKEGLPASQFLATGDAMAKRLVEVANGRK